MNDTVYLLHIIWWRSGRISEGVFQTLRGAESAAQAYAQEHELTNARIKWDTAFRYPRASFNVDVLYHAECEMMIIDIRLGDVVDTRRATR